MGLLQTLLGGRIPLSNNLLRWRNHGSLQSKGITDPIREGFEQNVDFYALIKKLVDVYNDVPYVSEIKIGDGWEPLDNPTYQGLLDNPNKGKQYTWNDIDERLLIYLIATGNSYLHGEVLNGRIEEVDVLPSNHVCVSTSSNFFLPNPKYLFEIDTTKKSFDQDEISHTLLFNPSYQSVEDSFNGLSLIQVAAMPVRVGNDRWDADANLLQNRGAIGLISDRSNSPMTAKEAEAAQIEYDRRTTGTDKFGKTIVTNKDLNFIQTAMSSTDLQLVEKGVVGLRAICNVLGFDSSLFNDPANKTFNNRKEAEKAMYTNAIMPWGERLVNSHNQFIVKSHYPDGNVRLRKDYSEVEALQADKKLEAEKDKKVMDGINVVANMPISNDAKTILIKDNYEVSDEFISALLKPQDNDTV